MGLKACGRLKIPKPSLCYGPGMWYVKQKGNARDQNTLQCYYGDYVTTNRQT